PALAGLAIPPDGQVRGRLGLDLVDCVEHHHPLSDLGGVVVKVAAPLVVRAPDAERRLGHHFISSITCFSSAGSSRRGLRRSCIAPPGPFLRTMFTLPKAGSLSGKSSRK